MTLGVVSFSLWLATLSGHLKRL